jgi:hypothetical protein
MCEEKLESVEAEGLKASHPRVAGIVQAHRQQIDAAGARQQQMSDEGHLAVEITRRRQ